MTIPSNKSDKLMMTAAYYKSVNNDKSDNNEDKIAGSNIQLYARSRARSYAKLYDYKSFDHNITNIKSWEYYNKSQ